MLDKNGWNHKDAPVFVQSFEVANLQALRKLSTVRLVQLVAPSGRPYDFVAQGAASTRSYADLVTAEGLKQVATYANAVGPFKTLVVPVKDGVLGEPTALVANARAAGLSVHIWTLRPENSFLPTSLRQAPASDATARGDSNAEITAYLRAGWTASSPTTRPWAAPPCRRSARSNQEAVAAAGARPPCRAPSARACPTQVPRRFAPAVRTGPKLCTCTGRMPQNSRVAFFIWWWPGMRVTQRKYQGGESMATSSSAERPASSLSHSEEPWRYLKA